MRIARKGFLVRIPDVEYTAATVRKAIDNIKSEYDNYDKIILRMNEFTYSEISNEYSGTDVCKITIDGMHTFLDREVKFSDKVGNYTIFVVVIFNKEEEKMESNEQVKNPSHYCDGRQYEPKDVIRDWGLNFNLGSAVKYISRAGRKDDIIIELNKAREFIGFEIEAIEQERKKQKEMNDNDALWS